MSKNTMTPEQKIEQTKQYIVILAQSITVLATGAAACTNPVTKKLFDILADTLTAVIFTLGCITGSTCDQCSPGYIASGADIVAKLDQLIVSAARVSEMAEMAKDPTLIPDPPKDTPIQ